MSENETRTYELGYLIVPNVPENEVAESVEVLKSMVQKDGGNIISEGNPEFIDLAYTIEKSVASKNYRYSQGYFGFLKFDTLPETLESLKKALDMNKNLIRYILIKTSVENTVVFKKPKVEAKREGSGDGEVIVIEDNDSLDDIDESVLDHEKLPNLNESASDVAEVEAEE